jgi:hypothetical protein
MSDDHLQNDPDRAGGLISDAQGEFVASESGGAFDPRAFRSDSDAPEPRGSDAPERPDAPAAADDEPAAPMNDLRMSSPGAEIDKAG